MNSPSSDTNSNVPARRMFIIVVTLSAISIFFQISCKKLVDVSAPVTSINAANVYTTDASAISVVTAIYKRMTTGYEGFTGLGSISMWIGLSADELTLYKGVTDARYPAYYHNGLISNTTQNYGTEFWSRFYNNIFVCNSAIEGLNNSTGLTPAVRQQLLGEAKFMRAFFYFYLTNMYGNVPLATSTDWNINSLLSNMPSQQIYQQIITDLKDAESILSTNYLDGTLLNSISDRVRPTKWAAAALLARAYLFSGDYANAESTASVLINNTSLFTLSTSLNDVFLANSKESIWQLQPTFPGHNTEDAWSFVIPSTGPSNVSGANTGHPVYLSQNLMNTFDSGDQRKVTWIDSVTVAGTTYYYPFKYKSAKKNDPVTEYLMVFRLGEQYLIRAEARIQLGKSEGASDLNAIRVRAGLDVYAGSTDKASLLNAIQHERQVELFTELGHRWFDMKRTGNLDAIMGAPGNACSAKGGAWQSYKQLFPMPFADITQDQNLKQNTGY